MALDFNSPGVQFVALIDAALMAAAEAPRTYLGASRIGEPCLRRLQYEVIGASVDEAFTGRTLRIFRRGHEGEALMAEWIRAAGFDLRTDRQGQQFGFEDCDGRFRGHIDGMLVGGPDGYAYPALWENKVLGSKGWTRLEKDGLAKAYPAYAGQVAIYQAYMELTEHPAFFTGLNADTMEISVHLVPFDQALAQECADKAARVLAACDHGEWLPRVADSAGVFPCRLCPFRGTCWP